MAAQYLVDAKERESDGIAQLDAFALKVSVTVK